jgi:hypothetical protein
MPAIRPWNISKPAAAMPINTPPIEEAIGVKDSMVAIQSSTRAKPPALSTDRVCETGRVALIQRLRLGFTGPP